MIDLNRDLLLGLVYSGPSAGAGGGGVWISSVETCFDFIIGSANNV